MFSRYLRLILFVLFGTVAAVAFGYHVCSWEPGHLQRAYDNLNRLTSCTDTKGNIVGYAYDKEGNLASITYPGNKTVAYTYDGSNRLLTVTDWAGRVTTYSYDSIGRLNTVVRPNGTRQRVTFDAANRLTASYEEQLSSSGLVVGTLWEGLYGYDNDDRLTSFQPFPMEQCLAPPAAAMTYDSDNQLATYNGQSLSHDGDGDLLSAPVNGTLLGALGWDARDRLLTAGGVTYTYDAENRRISSTVNSQTTYYVWSRGSLDQLLAKINPDGSVTRYIYGKGLLYEETTSASGQVQSPVFYHFDWRGDTVALSDINGNVLSRLCYNPYGETTVMPGSAAVTTPFQFNGKWGVMTEPSGLLCMQARFYSPVFRRFLNEDPSGFNGGTNMYAYAVGDPVNLLDPFGLNPIVAGSDGGPTIADSINNTWNAAQASAASYTMGQTAPPGYSVAQTYTVANGGTNAVLYQNNSDYSVILAYTGTQSASDWETNVKNAVDPQSARYAAAVSIAQSVENQYGGDGVTITGHSLGGGEAALAGVATGLPTITFNAAGVNPATYGYPSPNTSNITNYSVGYIVPEPLTTAQSVLPIPSALGTQVELPAVTSPTLGNAGNHSMGSVISSLSSLGLPLQ